jgi:hypothetical protein
MQIVLPLNDIMPHDEESTVCPCGPRVEFINGEMLITHNSFDGRELAERKHMNKELGKDCNGTVLRAGDPVIVGLTPCACAFDTLIWNSLSNQAELLMANGEIRCPAEPFGGLTKDICSSAKHTYSFSEDELGRILESIACKIDKLTCLLDQTEESSKQDIKQRLTHFNALKFKLQGDK